MREIKFKAYDKIADSWCFGIPVKDADVKGRWWLMFDESQGIIIDNPKTIGQYTGLKDKNGKEIYEGDIVEWNDVGTKPRKIIWDKYGWNVEHFWNSSYDYPGEAFSEDMIFEVIGDIYTNPELLK